MDTTAESYAAAARELRRIADALDGMTTDGLAELWVTLDISTAMTRLPSNDSVKIATVDAIALAVLDQVAATEAPSSAVDRDWLYHQAQDARRGPVTVRVWEMISDPRVAELERLRAELAAAWAQLAAADAAQVVAAVLTPDSPTLPGEVA